MSKKGTIDIKNETNNDCDGTFTFQPFVGGFPVKASIIVGSWRATYEASTFVAPLIGELGLSIKRIF